MYINVPLKKSKNIFVHYNISAQLFLDLATLANEPKEKFSVYFVKIK